MELSWLCHKASAALPDVTQRIATRLNEKDVLGAGLQVGRRQFRPCINASTMQSFAEDTTYSRDTIVNARYRNKKESASF